VDEFELIDAIVEALGPAAGGAWIRTGPGDDAAVIELSPGCDAVASIDTLIPDVHFPAGAPAELIGYRALMVALSDLAAMAADPRYVLVSLTLPEVKPAWVHDLTCGMSAAALRCGVSVCGGNITRGPLNIAVSVHGQVPAGAATLRSGAAVGEGVYVSGPLGGAAAAVRLAQLMPCDAEHLSALQSAYYRPLARFDCAGAMRDQATAALDISDGLIADLTHLARASNVSVDVNASLVPVHAGAELRDALFGGDDYEIVCTSAHDLRGFTRIGQVHSCTGSAAVSVDGEGPEGSGYRHF
jgi:thiamine-monophosphate kinase